MVSDNSPPNTVQRKVSPPQRFVAVNTKTVGCTQPWNSGIFLSQMHCMRKEFINVMNIAERLKDLRKEAGYSQEQVAELLNVSRQAVSKWESAQGYPDIENIVKLAQMYEISTDYLLLGKEPPARNAAEADISETVIPQSESQNKREMSPETKKTLRIIAIIVAIIGASALFTVFLIAALSVVERFLELTIRL